MVSRDALVESRFSTVICAPVFSHHDDLASQVEVGPEDGLSHPSSIHCDALVSLPKSALTGYVGALAPDRVDALNEALRIALAVE